MTEEKNAVKDENATKKTKKKVAVKKGKPNPNTKKKVVAKKKTPKKPAPAPEAVNVPEPKPEPKPETVTDNICDQHAASVAERLKQVADNAAGVAADAAQSTADAAVEAKNTIVDKAKAAYENIDTADFHAAADEATKKATDTAKKAGAAVKAGLATHGIDADKLAGALKNDAKGAATAVVGGAKFVSERFSSLVAKMDAKVNGDKGDEE